MPGSRIFLSYRRDDSSGHTELLYSRLAGYYGRAAVFRDVHAIQPMDRFREAINTALSGSAIVLVVISRQWSQLTGADGVRRLDQPDDCLRWEISSALQGNVRVLPVLVGGATMPQPGELPDDLRPLSAINGYEISDQRWEHDFEGLVSLLNQVGVVAAEPTRPVNPFSIRAGVRDDAFFHDRKVELGMLRDYLRSRQNCQLVGPRRIGKSSVLLFIQRHCTDWCPTARVAYLDLQDPRCFTLKGWLREVAQGFRLSQTPETLSDLMEAADDLLATSVQPVLCLDEFGEIARRHQEFPNEVVLTLRSLGQRGMSILTAAPKRLSELTDPHDDTSQFFNIFPVLPLRPYAPADARAFVEQQRPDVPDFTEHERERILEFAQGHPLALQAACYHVLVARESGETLAAALARAREDCGRTLG
jgi:TIR domain